MTDARTPRGVPVVCLALALLGLPSAWGQDAPHWLGELADVDCTNQCHMPHQAAGGTLTRAAGNVVLCLSCHKEAPGIASDLPIDELAKAVPHVGGIHHAFDVDATADLDGDGTDDVLPPQDAQRLLRVMGNKLVCSTCHNQHKAEKAYGGRSRVGNATKLTSSSGTGDLTAGGTFDLDAGVWYLVEIANGGSEATARFGFSKDGGTTWFPNNCSPGAAGPTDPWENLTGCLTANGTSLVLLETGGASVSFAAGTYVARDRWEFSASWPYLRWASAPSTPDALIDFGDNSNPGDRFCRDCHRPWVMDTAAVRDYTGAHKSHPVGVDIPTTAAYRNGVPLDGNGEPQGGVSEDANPTNDLRFGGSPGAGKVQCLTCHGVHFVDSLTQTVDQP